MFNITFLKCYAEIMSQVAKKNLTCQLMIDQDKLFGNLARS